MQASITSSRSNITEDEFHLQFNTNVLGTILAAKEAAKHFGPDGGSIINISSVASEQAVPTATVYSATKGAVDTLTRARRRAWPAQNPRQRHRAGRGGDRGTHAAGVIGSDFEKDMVARTPLGRLGQPDDIARIAVLLASDAAAWLTGERLSRLWPTPEMPAGGHGRGCWGSPAATVALGLQGIAHAQDICRREQRPQDRRTAAGRPRLRWPHRRAPHEEGR
jgi:NAD(P)-dependent dehydrogenase (short-subunit alcohol dehydrogenase family)